MGRQRVTINIAVQSLSYTSLKSSIYIIQSFHKLINYSFHKLITEPSPHNHHLSLISSHHAALTQRYRPPHSSLRPWPLRVPSMPLLHMELGLKPTELQLEKMSGRQLEKMSGLQLGSMLIVLNDKRKSK